MRHTTIIPPVALLTILLLAGIVFGQEYELRGVFIKLTEWQLDEQEYVGMVIRPLESDDNVVVLTPRRPEHVLDTLRKLREGQRVTVRYVRSEGEDGPNWLRGLEAKWRREGDGERAEAHAIALHLEGDSEQPQEERIRRGTERRREATERREAESAETREGRRRSPGAQWQRDRHEYERPWEGAELREGIAAGLYDIMRQLRMLSVRVERMEMEMQQLRRENQRLRGMLGRREGDRMREDSSPEARKGRRPSPEAEWQRDRGDRRREGEAQEAREGRPRRAEAEWQRRIALPDSLAGFKGVLTGKILRKMDRGFVLQLDGVRQVWDASKAENSQAAVGRRLVIQIPAEGDAAERFLRVLREVETGRRVLVEAFHLGGESLTVVEQLQVID